MNKDSPFYKWLKTQPKDFVDEIINNELFGNGQMTIENLAELDNLFTGDDVTNS